MAGSVNNYAQEEKLAQELGVSARHVCIVGSTLICGRGNDVDLLCLVPSEGKLTECGFNPDIEGEYESSFRSYRRDGQNVIATTDPSFFFAEVAIAHAARMVVAGTFDMAQREDRVRFHSAVRDQVLARMAEELF